MVRIFYNNQWLVKSFLIKVTSYGLNMFIPFRNSHKNVIPIGSIPRWMLNPTRVFGGGAFCERIRIKRA